MNWPSHRDPPVVPPSRVDVTADAHLSRGSSLLLTDLGEPSTRRSSTRENLDRILERRKNRTTESGSSVGSPASETRTDRVLHFAEGALRKSQSASSIDDGGVSAVSATPTRKYGSREHPIGSGGGSLVPALRSLSQPDASASASAEHAADAGNWRYGQLQWLAGLRQYPSEHDDRSDGSWTNVSSARPSPARTRSLRPAPPAIPPPQTSTRSSSSASSSLRPPALRSLSPSQRAALDTLEKAIGHRITHPDSTRSEKRFVFDDPDRSTPTADHGECKTEEARGSATSELRSRSSSGASASATVELGAADPSSSSTTGVQLPAPLLLEGPPRDVQAIRARLDPVVAELQFVVHSLVQGCTVVYFDPLRAAPRKPTTTTTTAAPSSRGSSRQGRTRVRLFVQPDLRTVVWIGAARGAREGSATPVWQVPISDIERVRLDPEEETALAFVVPSFALPVWFHFADADTRSLWVRGLFVLRTVFPEPPAQEDQ